MRLEAGSWSAPAQCRPGDTGSAAALESAGVGALDGHGTDNTAADALDERRLQVMAANVDGARWPTAFGLLVLAAIAWPAAPHALVVCWFLAAMACREVRAVVQRRMAQRRGSPTAPRLRQSALLAMLSGASFGAAAMFMVWADVAHGALLTVTMVSLAAGGLAVNSTSSRVFAAYALPIVLPLAVVWTLQGIWFGAAFGAFMLMGLGAHLTHARDNQKMFEESFRIRQENEALARGLEAERDQLAQARDEAERANRQKSHFLAAASHDLRQPLQALALNSGELERLALPGDTGAIARDIGASVDQLRSMLDALLDLSKLDSGVVTAQRRRVRLAPLLQGVVTGFRAPAIARGIALSQRCAADLIVDTDPDLMRRLVANLVDNGIKFTFAGAVSVEVDADESEVRIAVRDTGPGIAAADQRRVFEDLVQLPQPDGERAPGHGLGLGIVRRTAALLGIEVQLDSAEGRGCVFSWRMPRAGAQPGAATAAVSIPSLAGQRVLILDDDARVRNAYAHALSGVGAEVRAAGTIDEALLLAGDIDSAVVDWRLAGDEDGFAAIERLRALHRDIPMVMVTADTGRAIAEAAAQHRVALLRKPVDAATLASALGAAMKPAQLQ